MKRKESCVRRGRGGEGGWCLTFFKGIINSLSALVSLCFCDNQTTKMHLKDHQSHSYSLFHSGIISDACVEDSDCYDAVSASACTSGTCSCVSGYRSKSAGQECIKRKLCKKD